MWRKGNPPTLLVRAYYNIYEHVFLSLGQIPRVGFSRSQSLCMFLYEWFFHYVLIKWFGSLVTEIVHTSSISVSDLENQVSRMEWALSLGSLEPNLAGQMINQVSRLLHSPPTLLAPLAQRYDVAHWYGHERGSSNNNDASRWLIIPKYFSPTYEVHNDLLSFFSVFCLHWGKQFSQSAEFELLLLFTDC